MLTTAPTEYTPAAGDARACAAAGHACTSGDWGVGDQASFEAALAEAGQSSSSQASLCSGGYDVGSWSGHPSAYDDGRCFWQAGATTTCSASSSSHRRLCRCV